MKKCEWWINGHDQCGDEALYRHKGRVFCKYHAILFDTEYIVGKKSIHSDPNVEKIDRRIQC